jgi:hypothetical protein
MLTPREVIAVAVRVLPFQRISQLSAKMAKARNGTYVTPSMRYALSDKAVTPAVLFQRTGTVAARAEVAEA